MKKTRLPILLTMMAMVLSGCPASTDNSSSSDDGKDHGETVLPSTPASTGQTTPTPSGSGEETPSSSPTSSGETTPTGGSETPSEVTPSGETPTGGEQTPSVPATPSEVTPSTPVSPTPTEVTPSPSEEPSPSVPTTPTPTGGEETPTPTPTGGEVTPTPTPSYPSTPTPSPEVTLVSITLSGTYPTLFELGQEFSSDGLIVTAHYSNESACEVTSYTIDVPDMSTTGYKDVTVRYSEGTVDVDEIYVIEVYVEDDPALPGAKEEALSAIRSAFNELDVTEYSVTRWNKIINKLNEAISAIENAHSVNEVNSIKENTIEYFVNSPTAAEVRAGTWFDYGSAEGKYTFDRDDDNNLVVSYDGYPGNWVYIGTKTNLNGDINQYNALSVTFRNDFDQDIYVCLQATDADVAYKVDSHMMTIHGLETKTITLQFDASVSRLYFFVDSCSEHNHAGQITILDTNLFYEDRGFAIEPKTVEIENGTFATDDVGNSTYVIKEDDDPAFIERVDVLLDVDFNGNGSSKRYFGLHFNYGSKHVSFSDSQVHAREISGTTREYALYNIPMSETAKLKAGTEISLDVSYMPAVVEGSVNPLLFKVLSYTFYYGQFKEIDTEKIEVNQEIYREPVSDSEAKAVVDTKSDYDALDKSSFVEGDFIIVLSDSTNSGAKTFYKLENSVWVKKSSVANPISIPYSSFSKKGTVKKMDIEFESINNASYGKSQVYMKNFDFAVFPGSGNNNVANIAPIMDKNTLTPKTGTMTFYPLSNVDLTANVDIEITCWWSSAVNIKVKSITMYTEFVGVPSEVTNLEAHPIDSGMVLTWSSVAHSDGYDIYVDNEYLRTVKGSNTIIYDLNNDQEYTFGVSAKNATGASEMVTVKATPVEGAQYDTFIEALNNPLEEYLGEEKIVTIFDNANHYFNNTEFTNYRIRQTIEKMKNGEDTTIAFMGGSITVGETANIYDERHHQEGYAYYTYQWLKNNYDVAGKSEFINGSISGTGSEIGIVRSDKDIIDHNPDLVFIEFAANNGSSQFYKQSYESLIRRVLNCPSHPAVVLVFSCTTYTNNNSEYTYMSQIGQYYKLPMVSIDRGLRAVFSNITKTDPEFKRYSDDGTHPNNDGHQLMAKVVCNFLRETINAPLGEDFVTPANPSQNGYDKYEHLVAVDHLTESGEIKSLGSFAPGNTSAHATSTQSDVTAFQQGWIKSASSGNDAMVIEVNAKNFVLIYSAGNSAVANRPHGNIVVTYVNNNDPLDTGTLTWNVGKTCKQNKSDISIIEEGGNGWDNPVGILIFDKENASDYTITIQMAEEDSICWILAFGYSA